MNIQKTNLLILNKNFKMKENQSALMKNPISERTNANDGMKALMFQGQQNYLNNNVGFKGGLKQKMATYAAAGLMALGATGLQSCLNQDIDLNLEALVKSQEETNALLRELLKQGTINQDKYDEMIAQIKALRKQVEEHTISFEEYKQKVFLYIANDEDMQKQILAELQEQGMNQDEANEFLESSINDILILLKTGNISLEEALEALNGIKDGVDNIAAILTKYYNAWVEATAKAEKNKEIEIELAKSTNSSVNLLVDQGKEYLYNDSVALATQYEMLKKLDGIQADTKAITFLTQMLLAQGYTQMQIDQMNFNTMLQAVKEGNKIRKDNNAKLAALLELITQQGYVTEEQRAQIIELLKNIDANVSAILDTVNNLYKAYLVDSKKNDAFRTTMMVNGAINNQLLTTVMIDGKVRNNLLYENNQILNNMDEKLDQTNSKIDSLIILGNEKPDELKQLVIEGLEKGDEFIAAIKNININMSAEEMVEAIKDFKNTYIKTEAEKIKLQKEENAMLEQILPILKGIPNYTGDLQDIKDLIEAKGEYTAALETLAKLIKANTKAVEDGTKTLADASAEELKAQEEANEFLKKLLAKTDEILVEVKGLAKNASNYYNKIINKFDEIKGLLPDIVDKINLILVKFNTVIDQNDKLQETVEQLKLQLDKIEAATGKPITKEELDQLMTKHGDDLKTLLTNLHVETSADLDEVKDLIRQGNEQTKQLKLELEKHKDNPETLKQIKHILETRDFCDCPCTQGDINNNEGILEEIQGITG